MAMTPEQMRKLTEHPAGLAVQLSESAAVTLDALMGVVGPAGVEVLRFMFVAEFLEGVLYDPDASRFAFEMKFPNGYRGSVIRSRHSYGGAAGLFELAVKDPEGNLDYDTPITRDVVGHLTASEAAALLWLIGQLPTHPRANL
jgi:hypothetical protein